MTRTGIITRTVWMLSLVSLFTDVASEMLYPVMPLYLRSIGFSIVLIGVLEGMAEATAGLSKGYFGSLSDVHGKRLPFVRLGYFLSALSKPLMAVFAFPLWVFGARTLDRLGKGVRTGARDAMLSAEATPQTKGAVFGFHRGMDTAGAAIGPLAALLFLYFFPQRYRLLFFLAFVPGILAVFISFLLKERPAPATIPKRKVGFSAIFNHLSRSTPEYRRLLVGLLAFALFNSSDVFLLLMLKHLGFSDMAMIGVYIFYNLVYAVFAYPLGKLADKMGLRRMFIFGLLIFGCVYAGMAYVSSVPVIYFLFFMYGIYAATTEGVSKAWISNLCRAENTASAIGTYEGLRSVAAMLASSVTGLIWYSLSPQTAFLITAVATGTVIIYFMWLSRGHSDMETA